MLSNLSDSIFELVSESLSEVPYHSSCINVERLIAKNFPIHLALHRICSCDQSPNKFSLPHRHDVPEINVIIGEKGQLEYLIRLGEEEYPVESPSTIWIPAGVEHSANLIRGSGYFLCLIF